MGGFHRDPQFHSKAFQATGYGTGILCGRKHTMVVLRDERHAVRFEPLVGIPVTELFEKPPSRACAHGVDLFQVCHTLKSIGQVAASAARDQYFFQYIRLPFEYRDLHLRRECFQVDGQKEAGRSSANDCYLHCFHDSFLMGKGKYNRADLK